MTTPEKVLNSVVEGINTGNLDCLMMLYETDACFASQPGGQLAKSPETIRQSLRSFTDINGKLDLKVKSVLQTSDLALVISEWSFSGTGPSGKLVNMAAKSAGVLRRQQADGTWRFVIDNPWGADYNNQQEIII